MSGIAELSPSMLDHVRHDLVGPEMPRALEALDQIVGRLEHAEISALEAIDILLAEGADAARERPHQTLAGFDYSFQPSLDRDRILTFAQVGLIARSEVIHFLGPPDPAS